jgi:hypothetical protein
MYTSYVSLIYVSMTDSTSLSYVPTINDRHYRIMYDGIDTIIDMTTGYIHADKFCNSASNGSKELSAYRSTQECKDLVDYMDKHKDKLTVAFISVTTGHSVCRGTYIHPKLIYALSMWISPAAYFSVRRILDEWMRAVAAKELHLDDEFGHTFERMSKRILIADDENGEIEVKSETGLVDVLTDTKVIQVGRVCDWKDVFGEALVYGISYPNLQPWIYLFGRENKFTASIITTCNAHNVQVKYIK